MLGARQRPRLAAHRQIQVDMTTAGGGSQRAPGNHNGWNRWRADLGEYIIQTGATSGPYHIVAPALHLTRYDVADLFHQAAQRPARDGDREADRHRPRGVAPEVFAGDIGISGANFLVAGSGARSVLVENESNIRLTTSAPKSTLPLRESRR